MIHPHQSTSKSHHCTSNHIAQKHHLVAMTEIVSILPVQKENRKWSLLKSSACFYMIYLELDINQDLGAQYSDVLRRFYSIVLYDKVTYNRSSLQLQHTELLERHCTFCSTTSSSTTLFPHPSQVSPMATGPHSPPAWHSLITSSTPAINPIKGRTWYRLYSNDVLETLPLVSCVKSVITRCMKGLNKQSVR